MPLRSTGLIKRFGELGFTLSIHPGHQSDWFDSYGSDLRNSVRGDLREDVTTLGFETYCRARGRGAGACKST
jgi:hypothetical protein